MSFLLYAENCDNKIQCTYNEWNIFRKSIIKSFIIFLEDQIVLNTYNSIHVNNEIKYLISHYYSTIENDSINFNNFNKIFDNYYINLFISYDYYGFYVFITKEDFNSYFSIGNSYDICVFFNLIEELIENSHIDMFNNLQFLLLFSYNNKIKLCIK